jgi:hypothetical protein
VPKNTTGVFMKNTDAQAPAPEILIQLSGICPFRKPVFICSRGRVVKAMD